MPDRGRILYFQWKAKMADKLYNLQNSILHPDLPTVWLTIRSRRHSVSGAKSLL
ncbi:unnamed protein product [Ranitomeya imitator]|uniref:Ycf15 n=1 Tax=Ranitomeya imitator TaxID=111125 RepID=A0ABN9LIF6_9NEOB|nr:unnamed protein product [Ranitomeya imitator]